MLALRPMPPPLAVYSPSTIGTMDLLMGIPITLPSVEGQPSLEPIPGSAAVTPLDTRRNSPEQSPEEVLLMTGGGPVAVMAMSANAEAGPSRPSRSRASSITQNQYALPGSYFPVAGAYDPPSPKSIYRSFPSTPSNLYPPAMSPSQAGASSHNDRPRPEPLEIPPGTPDEPLFSAYPDTLGPRRRSIARLAMPLRSALHLADYAGRHSSPRQFDTSDPSSSVMSSGSSSPSQKPRGRKRAATVSSSPPFSVTSFTVPKPVHPLDQPSQRLGRQTSISHHFRLPSILRRRRASLGAKPHGRDFSREEGQGGHWPKMAQEEEMRMHLDASRPFAYPQSANHQLEQVSTYTTVKPLSTPSIIPSRRSSLIGASGLISPDIDYDAVILPDAVPPTPPPRRSSLSFGPDQIIAIGSAVPPSPRGNTSVLSASATSTEASSGEFFSPTLSHQHPLSSATTSLSRSAKSGKDKEAEDNEAEIKQVSTSLAALRLQRSLEWEAKQARRRRRLEKRKMILLELVETEVAYAEDLRLLVQVYLPQLSALPSITPKMASVIGRNAGDLLVIHSGISVEMVEILRQEQLGFRCVADEQLEGKVERVSRRIAGLLVNNATSLSAYNAFCSGSIAAAGMVRNLSLRTDYDAFEKRCHIICASCAAARLQDLLDETPDNMVNMSNRSRLQFKDYLIMPVQRVCRYPLLLSSLLGSTDTPSSPVERQDNMFDHMPTSDDYDVGVDVERALGAMRGVAEEADEARRRTEAEIRSATVMGRIEPHHSVTPAFLRSMGTCRLIGSMDVLYHHPTLAPLLPPVKVKYLAVFLYKGYLVLAKVKKTKTYEVKHFLPLEVFELIDITEGFLPHSIRLTLREHNFDLAASCSAEKEVWTAALVAARDESTIPPFELPASIAPFATRTRRQSTVGLQPPVIDTAISLSPLLDQATKRHTMASFPDFAPVEVPAPVVSEGDITTSPVVMTDDASSPHDPISLSSHGLGSMSSHGHPTGTSTLLLRRATPAQRLIVDRGLLDVFSDSCAQARSKAQLHRALFLPDAPRGSEMRDRLQLRESTMLRRRKSFLDARTRTHSMDIAFTGEVKGSIMDRPKSLVGTKRTAQKDHVRHQTEPLAGTRPGAGRDSSYDTTDDTPSTEADADNADDSATAGGTSDFGTLRGREFGTFTRTTSVASVSPPPGTRPMNRRSLSLFRPSFDASANGNRPPVPTMVSMPRSESRENVLQKSVRRTASVMNLSQRARQNASKAKSTPTSPQKRAREVKDQQKVQRASSDPQRHDHGDIDSQDSVWVRRDSSPVHTAEMPQQAALGDAQVVYHRGQGLTNTPERERNSWSGSIRRGVSMLKSRGNSSVNLPETGSASSSAMTGLGLMTGSGTQTSSNDDVEGVLTGTSGVSGSGSVNDDTRANDDGSPGAKTPEELPPPVKRSNSALFLSHFGGTSRAEKADIRSAEDDERDRVETTPRRRRSVKLLQTLRGFTPM